MMHAYCIITHNEPKLFKILIELLDDKRNDIYVYLDKKTDKSLFDSTSTKYSRIFFLDNTCYLSWGSPELLNAELVLLKFAHSHGKYSRYHLISGVDLPIRTQDYIHDFLDCRNAQKEFIGVVKSDVQDSWIKQRTGVYYFFKNHLSLARECTRFGKLLFHFQDRFVTWQMYHPIFRRNYDVKLKMGPQWFSLTNSCVEYLLAKEKTFFCKFKYTKIPDEIAIQSAVWNSPFKENIYDLDDQYHSCLRKIDWTRGGPYVWREKDFEELMSTDCLFARKFSCSDMNIVNKIVETLCKGE